MENTESTKRSKIYDFTETEQRAFLTTIPLKPLNDFLSELLQITVELQMQITTNRNGKLVIALSDESDISKTNPILRAAWSSMQIQTAYSIIDVESTTETLYFTASIHLVYKHHDFGENGAEIAKVIYKDGEWECHSSEELASLRRR